MPTPMAISVVGIWVCVVSGCVGRGWFVCCGLCVGLGYSEGCGDVLGLGLFVFDVD